MNTMKDLKRIGAWTILITMLAGLGSEAYSQVAKNIIKIARIEEREKSTRELIIDIKDDVEYIRRNLRR